MAGKLNGEIPANNPRGRGQAPPQGERTPGWAGGRPPPPLLPCREGGLDGLVHVVLRREGHAADPLACGGGRVLQPLRRPRRSPFPAPAVLGGSAVRLPLREPGRPGPPP